MESPVCWCTYSEPATAARNPENANAANCVRVAFTPYARAARSFSRMAMRTRPVRDRRSPTTMTSARASTASEA